MGAARRARRQIERAQMKDAARRVRAIRLAEAAEAQAIHAEAMMMTAAAETFAQPSGLVRDPQTGVPVYALGSELSDGE